MISVVIPVKENDEHIEFCLGALFKSIEVNLEIIIVLDGWNRQFELCSNNHKMIVIQSQKAGPAHCRNIGAEKASSKNICFVDSDVEVHPDSILNALIYLDQSQCDGVVGSYDDEPSSEFVVSKFRNLLHHYHHQRNHGKTGVFWGAFTVISKAAFVKVGGFNEKYKTPSIEDIELGYSLLKNKYRVEINASLFVKHRKRWTLKNMIYTDIFLRAAPWTVLLNQQKILKAAELNTSASEKIIALVALLCAISLFAISISIHFLILTLALIVMFTLLQNQLYNLFYRKFRLIQLPSLYLLNFTYYYSAIAGYLIGNIKSCKTRK